MSHRNTPQNGYILMLVLISAFVFTIALMGITNLTFATYKAAHHALLDLNSLAVAEGGADASIVALNTAANSSQTYNGTTAPTSNVCALATSSTASSNAVVLYNNSTQGKATYETCLQDNTVINNSSNPSQNRYEKILYSVGKIYQPATASHPVAVSRVKLILEGSPAGDYSVQTGPGGLSMSNSAVITNGNVFVGGTLSMINTSQIGTLATPVTVSVANYNCPATSPYTNYPQLCATADPVTISNLAHIYGTVNANGQNNGSGMSSPGLNQKSGIPNTALPPYDEAGQISRVTNTMPAQNCKNNDSLTIPANTKITGDLTVSNNCRVDVQGDFWVTGNMSLSNSAVIYADSGVTSTIHVMIDGSQGLTLSNTSAIATNLSGIGFLMATNYSTAACGSNCTAVTGQDLVNSRGIKTITINNQSLAAGVTFFARWTALSLTNGGSVGAILAQTISLSNSGSIAFGQSSAGNVTYSWSERYYEQMPVTDAQTTN